MQIMKIYQVDAFAKGPFSGNPAAIVPLKEWLDEETMQNIAMENNLSETAYFVPENDGFRIRWFTPGTEVKLCGHATLASAYVLFEELNYSKVQITFYSKSGPLYITKVDDLIQLDFPSDEPKEIDRDMNIEEGLGASPVKTFKGDTDFMLVFEHESQILEMKPNFSKLAETKARGILVTALSEKKDIDFVSRGFFPSTGINEDPATGSAHTTMTPYWSKRLNKNKMKAIQISKRKGFFEVEQKGDRTLLRGKGALYMKGEIYI